MAFCGGCGAPRVPGDQFCSRCGRAYATDEPSLAQPGPAATYDEPFPGWAGPAAGVAVFVAPFISLIVALVMGSSEQRPSRRSFLKTWAIASGAWLGTGFLIVIIVIASVTSHSAVVNGKCKNGPDTLTPPSYMSQDGRHWTATVQCIGGGSITRPATKSEERWLSSH